MKILGISSYFHDSSAALIIDGELSFAAHEERYTRIKHDSSFPLNTVKKSLEFSGLNINEIDYFVYFEKPILKFERILDDYFKTAPRAIKSFQESMPMWLKEKLFTKSNILKQLKSIGLSKNNYHKLKFSEHHLSHMASAFFPSPFINSAILTIDGVGENSSTCIGKGDNNKIEKLEQINYPDSLGLLYSAFTQYLGFKVNSGEYKLMGLAPYGEPKYVNLILDNLVQVYNDGSFKLNHEFFDYRTGLKMINKKFEKLFDLPTKNPNEKFTEKYIDIAKSIQCITEDISIGLVKRAKDLTKSDNLCMAGGVALNCVSNTKIYNSKIFENIWIQPASGDAGTALGAALLFYYNHTNKEKKLSRFNVYSGCNYQTDEIEIALKNAKIEKFSSLDNDKLCKTVAMELSKQNAVGWFQGRMEFGPRALGSRSILADPRPKDMQSRLNIKIKYRESFRPFAPSVLKEHINEFFYEKIDNPHMLFICNLKDKYKSTDQIKYQGLEKLKYVNNEVTSISHVDNTARVQSVSKEDNELYYNLINEFYNITNVPMIINTSFNIRGEPIVASPSDAIRCFLGTDLDILVINNYIIYKKDIPHNIKNKNYQNEFEKD